MEKLKIIVHLLSNDLYSGWKNLECTYPLRCDEETHVKEFGREQEAVSAVCGAENELPLKYNIKVISRNIADVS